MFFLKVDNRIMTFCKDYFNFKTEGECEDKRNMLWILEDVQPLM